MGEDFFTHTSASNNFCDHYGFENLKIKGDKNCKVPFITNLEVITQATLQNLVKYKLFQFTRT